MPDANIPDHTLFRYRDQAKQALWGQGGFVLVGSCGCIAYLWLSGKPGAVATTVALALGCIAYFCV